MVGTAASPASRIGRALGWGPLRWLGVRSYGIYLWHYPIIVLTTPAGGQDTLARGAWQVAASIGVAELSWRYIEEPVRRGAIGRCLARARAARWDLRAAGRRVWIPAAGAGVVCVLAGAGLTGAVPVKSAAASNPPHPVASSARAAPHRPVAPATASGPTRSSCRSVVHLGDSPPMASSHPTTCPTRGSVSRRSTRGSA